MSIYLRRKVALKSTTNKPDLFLLVITLILTILGLIIVADVSVIEAYRDFGDKFYYLKLQAQWALIGLFGFFGSLNFNFKNLKKFAFPLLFISLFFLLAVLIPGVGIRVLGAKRWLGIGGIRFQPSELAKFSFILWAASFLSKKRKTAPFLFLLIIFGGLIMLQPDLGTTIILAACALTIYFASGAPIFKIFLICLFALVFGIGLIFSSSYRRERFLTYLNPNRDPLGNSYHIRQILIALGSGGFGGLGLGQSRQKYAYIPAITTDSIFAIIAEETGFLGAMVLLLLFLALVWRGFKIAKEAPDDFSRLLAIGIISWIGFQTLLNLSSMTVLIPLTGIPLPFISYGGSSLVLNLTAIGILANISKYKTIRK